MTQKYPGGFVTLTPPTQNPALGAATPGIWTLDQALNAEVTRSWPMYDPYYKNVVLNLHGEGTNGAQNNTFVDSGPNTFTITRNGNTTQGSFSPYGQGWSNYFDGAGDYFSFPNTAGLSFGTGDFCVEAWVFKATAANESLIDSRVTTSAAPWALYVDASGFPYFYDGTSYTSTTAITLNTWTHVAVTRSSGTLKIFVNGVQGYSATVTTNLDRSSGYQVVGANVTGSGNYWTGYISNLRIVKGSAVYTSAFTPSTTPLTAITNTTLLTCQSNRFVDNSASPNILTTTGNISVQRFQPFLFPTSYTPSTIGGSGYFDGSGDYLSTSNVSNLQMSSGDFTVEFWFYPTNVNSTSQRLVTTSSGSITSSDLLIRLENTNVIRCIVGSTSILPSSPTVTANAWHHVALVRSGSGSNNCSVYFDGSRIGQGTSTDNISNGIQFFGGYYSTGPAEFLYGYMSDIRVLKGTALYSGTTCAIPTAPLTSITNTQLLTNMTNAGIVDNAMMNDLETVGNAQISTSVKKYGTGSMAFDGTGDYLVGAPWSSPTHAIGSGDFTVEAWLYTNSNKVQIVLDTGTSSGSTTGLQCNLNVSGYPYAVLNNSVILTSSIVVSTTTWTHVAWVRSGGTLAIYVNGVSGGTAANTTNASDTGLTIGTPNDYKDTSGTYHFNGYIDDLRITKGVARYVANFTPPTSQLQDQ